MNRKAAAALFLLMPAAALAARPNVVLIITDDQGYGHLGCEGNRDIQTPHIDRFSKEAVSVKHFYTTPLCAPTRAGLMTGRYNYRTGVVDTYLGRAMMFAGEVTLAEMLAKAGYRTGIFGKWHLGDTYPMRATDQGFQEAVVHKGGGIGQPADPPGNSYFDPVLQHNNQPKKFTGYCTDIFFNEALRFIEQNRDQPFFTYIPTNAPHSPYDVSDEWADPYRKKGLNDKTARVYGMIANIDHNVGRLLKKLEELRLDKNTIVIYMSDNGMIDRHFTAGLRAQKGSTYEGGIRVPFYIRWPERLHAGTQVHRIAAHIDVAPTLLDACGVKPPANVAMDGRSLLPLLTGQKVQWPDRTLYLQTHRGDAPELYRNFTARSQRFKLVSAPGINAPAAARGTFELYDIAADPGEMKNVARQYPEEAAALRKGYEAWFKNVSATRGYDPPRILLGDAHENPVMLTRQDWRGAEGWGPKDLGHWEVEVARRGTYQIGLLFAKLPAAGEVNLRLGPVTLKQPVERGGASFSFDSVRLPEGEARLEAWVTHSSLSVGVEYVEVTRLE